MVRVPTILVCMMAAHGAQACPSFGLETDYLAQFFCREFDELAGPATRNFDIPPDSAVVDAPAPEWMELPFISEAWRVDPAATLELIERIRAAGGRPMN